MDDFLNSLDEGLADYKKEFQRFSVTSINTLKYLRQNEVNSMKIPEVYKRLVMDKIIDLQTQETKTKMKLDRTTNSQPKKLKFNDDESIAADESERMVATPVRGPRARETGNGDTPATANFLITEKERINDEKETLTVMLMHKHEELKSLTTKPEEVLGIPGNPVTKFTCDNCHHRGYRSMMNKGNKACPYLPCDGFYACGLDTKHAEHKHAVSEVTKEIATIDKQMKNLGDERNSINMFTQHNSINFVNVLRPVLKSQNGIRYSGKDGQQRLQRDLRILKVACNGKIPEDLSEENIEKLMCKGKEKVHSVAGDFDNSISENSHPLPPMISNVMNPTTKPEVVAQSPFSPMISNVMNPVTSWQNYYPSPSNYLYPWNFTPYYHVDSAGQSSHGQVINTGAEKFIPPLPKEDPPAKPPLPN